MKKCRDRANQLRSNLFTSTCFPILAAICEIRRTD